MLLLLTTVSWTAWAISWSSSFTTCMSSLDSTNTSVWWSSLMEAISDLTEVRLNVGESLLTVKLWGGVLLRSVMAQHRDNLVLVWDPWCEFSILEFLFESPLYEDSKQPTLVFLFMSMRQRDFFFCFDLGETSTLFETPETSFPSLCSIILASSAQAPAIIPFILCLSIIVYRNYKINSLKSLL